GKRVRGWEMWEYPETRGGREGWAKDKTTAAKAASTMAAITPIRREGHTVFRGASTSISFGSGGRGATSRESDQASRAKPKSEADWKRCSGFFSRQRCTTLCNAGERYGAICEMR